MACAAASSPDLSGLMMLENKRSVESFLVGFAGQKSPNFVGKISVDFTDDRYEARTRRAATVWLFDATRSIELQELRAVMCKTKTLSS